MSHASSVNKQILEQFNAAGIEFAFPTRTLHLEADNLIQDVIKTN